MTIIVFRKCVKTGMAAKDSNSNNVKNQMIRKSTITFVSSIAPYLEKRCMRTISAQSAFDDSYRYGFFWDFRCFCSRSS